MLIPISLYVSIEIVKLGQIYFIHNDLDFYNEQLDSRIQCRALNITEDLGQIQYLFSDKTGTLTENKMVFRRCSIYGVEYPHVENGVISGMSLPPVGERLLLQREMQLCVLLTFVSLSQLGGWRCTRQSRMRQPDTL